MDAGQEAASPGVARRYSGDDVSSDEGELFLTPLGGTPTKSTYEDVHLTEKREQAAGTSEPETAGEDRDESLHVTRPSTRPSETHEAALASTVLSPGDPTLDDAGAPKLKSLEVGSPADMADEGADDPRTPLPRYNEDFVSPKSLSLSPNVKALGKGEGSAPAEKADGRRRQLLEHMDNLWRILGEVCEHSSLPERDLAGTMSRIEKLKGMSEELGTLEIDLEALHKVYTYESKAYLSKLRRLEEEVTSGSGSGEVEEEGAPSYGQNAIDGSFSRSVCKILYDDKRENGVFQLVSAKIVDGAGQGAAEAQQKSF